MQIMAAHQEPDIQQLLDHDESQRILKEESLRVGDQDLSTFFEEVEDAGLEGDPLSLKQVRKLCPNHFVRETLFRISGRAKETAPLKLSDLQHTGLARTLIARFIQKERALPNNNQIAIYFVQQCYVQDVLRKKVNWRDRPLNAGVGRGRIAERMQAQRDDAPEPPRKRPVVLLPDEHAQIVGMATQGATLASQGETVDSLTQRVAQLTEELQAANEKLAKYQRLYGDLPVGEEQPSASNELFNYATLLETQLSEQ